MCSAFKRGLRKNHRSAYTGVGSVAKKSKRKTLWSRFQKENHSLLGIEFQTNGFCPDYDDNPQPVYRTMWKLQWIAIAARKRALHTLVRSPKDTVQLTRKSRLLNEDWVKGIVTIQYRLPPRETFPRTDYTDFYGEWRPDKRIGNESHSIDTIFINNHYMKRRYNITYSFINEKIVFFFHSIRFPSVSRIRLGTFPACVRLAWYTWKCCVLTGRSCRLKRARSRACCTSTMITYFGFCVRVSIIYTENSEGLVID